MASLFDQPVLGGLFGDIEGPQRQGLNMGLLGLGLGMLESGKISPGLRNFMPLYQSGLESGQKRQEKEAEKQRREAAEKAYQDLINPQTQLADGSGAAPGGRFGNLSPEQRTLLSALPPEQGMKILTEQTFQTPSAPTADIQKYQFAQQQGYQGTFQDFMIDQRRAGAPTTNVNLPTAEEAEQKAFGTDLVNEWTTIRTDADAASGILTQLQIAQNIPVTTGALEPWKAKVSALAQGIGVDPSAIGLESATNAEAFVGIMQNLVLAKMQAQKGPQTENDAKRIQQTVASLGNTPQAADFLLKSAVATERRKVEQAQFYDQWRSGHGSFKGARAAWNEYKSKTPLLGVNPNSGLPVFLDEFKAAVRQANPGASDTDILTLWRQKYGGSN